MRPRLALIALALLAAPVRADDTMPPAPYAWRQLPDPAKEAKARALMATIRCLVCQSQSIIDSDASLAGDMRSIIRARINAGEDPEAIRAWLVARYGDYITYAPRVNPVTWPLFAAPVVLLLLGLGLVRGRFGRDHEIKP